MKSTKQPIKSLHSSTIVQWENISEYFHLQTYTQTVVVLNNHYFKAGYIEPVPDTLFCRLFCRQWRV